MAINLMASYEAAVLNKWIGESYIAGKLSNEYTFVGVRSINIYTPITVALQDYNRSGAVGTRFGTTTEMQDEVQELTMSQDKSFSVSIDKGNQSDQKNIKGAAKMLKLEIDEQLVPFCDQYTIARIAREGGKSVVLGAAVSASNIVGYINTARTWFTNNKVPLKNRHLLISATNYGYLRMATEFLAVDQLAVKNLQTGVVGSVLGFIVTEVPDDYFPTDLAFLAFNSAAGINPYKLKTLRILETVAGLDGSLLEGRVYFDAFVLGKRANGIYAAIANGSALKVATPVITPTGASHAATCATSGNNMKYTLDGTDPRYSKSAVVYSSAVTLTSGQTIKVAAFKAGLYGSDVQSATY